ncbi:MAG: prephenate dehydrogenase/arogenate dehydrogenase family protein [Gaiellaceae bacterium]
MRIVVVGTGLIGGSIGLAARARLAATVVGVDPAPQPALEAGAIEAALPLEKALAGADVAFVATPVPALAGAVADVLAAAPDDCVVTDTGSVKRELVAAVDDERFVGGHPLAGSETGGARAAREELFDGATWYLTPTRRTSGMQLERLHRLLGGLGARPAVVEAEAHDRLMAAVSHLPHALANVLVGRATRALGEEAVGGWANVGPSFRDATRVAGANPELWSGIYAANREALVAELDGALDELGRMRERLVAGEDLRDWQEHAARESDALRTSSAGEEVAELAVVVPNRPGVIADVALTLSREGINIADMSLAPSPDMATGALVLWVPAAREQRAAELLAGLGVTPA